MGSTADILNSVSVKRGACLTFWSLFQWNRVTWLIFSTLFQCSGVTWLIFWTLFHWSGGAWWALRLIFWTLFQCSGVIWLIFLTLFQLSRGAWLTFWTLFQWSGGAWWARRLIFWTLFQLSGCLTNILNSVSVKRGSLANILTNILISGDEMKPSGYSVWQQIPKSKLSWDRSQHHPTQRNLRGGNETELNKDKVHTIFRTLFQWSGGAWLARRRPRATRTCAWSCRRWSPPPCRSGARTHAGSRTFSCEYTWLFYSASSAKYDSLILKRVS